MKKYLFVYDAKTSSGGHVVGSVAADEKKLTVEAIRGAEVSIANRLGEGSSVVVTNVIELEG